MKNELEHIEISVRGVNKLVIACHPLDAQKIIDDIIRFVDKYTELVPANLSRSDTPANVNTGIPCEVITIPGRTVIE